MIHQLTFPDINIPNYMNNYATFQQYAMQGQENQTEKRAHIIHEVKQLWDGYCYQVGLLRALHREDYVITGH